MTYNNDPCGTSSSQGEWCFEVATTHEARMAGYRVRYEGLTAQLGDERYADHTSRTYIDPWDTKTSSMIISQHFSGLIAGTLRYQRRNIQPFPADELYDFKRYAALIGCSLSDINTHVALLDRAAVLPDYQRGKLYTNMQLIAEDISKASGVSLHTALVAQGNTRMVKVFEATGWKRSGRDVTYNRWFGSEFYKLL